MNEKGTRLRKVEIRRVDKEEIFVGGNMYLIERSRPTKDGIR